jgi:hypothetical protein
MSKKAIIAERHFLIEKLRAAAKSIGVPSDDDGLCALMWIASEAYGWGVEFEDFDVSMGRSLVNSASGSRSRIDALVSLGVAAWLSHDGMLPRPGECEPFENISDIRELCDFAFLVGMAVAAVNEYLEI